MARKGLSYGPDALLIKGERDVARSVAAKNTLPGMAFDAGFSQTLTAGLKEQAESKARVDAYSDMVKLPQNITKINENNQTDVVGFVRGVRENVRNLAAQYERTKDPNIRDQIQMEMNKVVNLNDQLGSYTQETRSYIETSDKGQIHRGKSFDYNKYDNIFTKNTKFNIEPNGDIGFISSKDNKSYYDKYNDVSGRWNVKNNIWETGVLSLDSNVYSNAQKGGNFDAIGIKNNLSTLLQRTGPEGAQVAFETDITGDENFVLPNGQRAGNLSFEAMWSSGGMDPKFYEGFTAKADGTYDSSWMFDDANAKMGIDLMTTYTTDVMQNRHDDNFIQKRQKRQQNPLLATYPALGSASYTIGPTGANKKWTNPGIKQQAFNFFAEPRQDGTVYDGQHGYYVQIPTQDGGSVWASYKSANDYKKDKASGYKTKDLRIGTYSSAEVLGFEAGLNLSGGTGDRSKYNK